MKKIILILASLSLFSSSVFSQYTSSESIKNAFQDERQNQIREQIEYERLAPQRKREEEISNRRMAECKRKLPEIISNCAAAGNIVKCVLLRGKQYGVRYNNMFELPDPIDNLTCN